MLLEHLDHSEYLCSNRDASIHEHQDEQTDVKHKKQKVQFPLRPSVIITAFSYEHHTGLVRYLATVMQEAEHISTVLPCIKLDHPSIAEFKESLADCKVWFFLGKGGVMVHNRHALVFTGENGLTSNGLVALSTNLLTSLINTHGPHLRLIVLNGCKTFDAAQTILLQCPAVEYCICWTTLVESQAASIFAKAFADMLAVNSYLTCNDGLATVFTAFHGAKAAVLEQKTIGRAHGVGPIGMPVYASIDPQADRITHQECPCVNRCQNCPWIGRQKYPDAYDRMMPPIAAGIPVLLSKPAVFL